LRARRFVLDNPPLLVAGTVTALFWANLDLHGYERVAHALHFAVNDVGPALSRRPAARSERGHRVHGSALLHPAATL
jgi:hypothetical protein